MTTTFNIQRYSLHDGPGIRTTVFLKGCPLRCFWCHNPESQSFSKEIMIYKDKCISCGSCTHSCTCGGITNKAACTLCGNCCNECPTNARVMAGEDLSIAEIITEVEKDRIFYDQSGGGVTISGGEPLSHYDFLLELVQALKHKGLHVAIDTSGYTSQDKLLSLSSYTDLFLYDIKCVDDNKHKLYTGVSNKTIIENLILLSKAGKDVIIRIPIIPKLNDTTEDIDALIRLFQSNNISYTINLLPYHNISIEKYKRLERSYAIDEIKEPTQEHMEAIKHIFEKNGFQTRIGG